MTDILCPTCGRPNPEDHSFCDFCGTPIKDLDNFSFDEPEQKSQDSEDESSRLDSFFSDQESPEKPVPDEISDPSGPSDDPFQLDDILQPPEDDPSLDDSSVESLRLDDFLKEDRPPSAPSEADDAGYQVESPPSPEEVDPLPKEETDIPLDDLFSTEDPPEEPHSDDDFQLDDLFSPEEDEDRQTKDDDFQLDDLFPEGETEVLPESEVTPEEELTPSEPTGSEEPTVDSWLESLSLPADEYQETTPSEDRSSIEGSPPDTPTEQPSTDTPPDEFAPEAEDEVSDFWSEPQANIDPVDSDDDSGWLDMLQDPGDLEDLPVDEPSSSEEEKQTTDWLDRIKRLNKSADLVEDDSSFPDWLTVSEKPATDEIPEGQPEEGEEEPPSDLPDWLQLDEDDESLNEFLRKKDLTNEEFSPATSDELLVDESLPESYGAPEPEEDPSQPKKFPSWAEGEGPPEKVPDDLQFLTGTDQGQVQERIVDPFQGEDDYLDDLFSDELPEWLSQASSEEEILPFEDEISLGELPGWVEAMRPVVESSDASGLAEDEDYIENYGPLAGIPSVIPAEADIVQDPDLESKKPLDLVASKSHQEYVNVLKKLIGDESKSKQIPQAAPVQTQRILRWLIALILLVTTAGSIVFGDPFVNLTPIENYSPNSGFVALHNQIDQLSDDLPVLIAYDYQPASAGELHTAAAGVVDHLMDQENYLAFISTEPTGPALAEHFLENTQSSHDYRHTQQYVNLGYLPGESAGLLSFIVAPKKIIPLAFDGSNAWGAPPLLEVNSIQDFSMIMVITDDPNTAKIWIEQVGTILEDTPLTMVVSAQVEPLIQPYFRSSPQLVSGYVAGVIDSMNYEHLNSRPNLATDRWLPFNIGILISVGTIFIGGLANGVLSLFSRHRARRLEK